MVKLLFLLLLAFPALADAIRETPFAGVTHVWHRETEPRAVSIHVVTIDLTQPGLRFKLTPAGGTRETVRQRTLDFLRAESAQVAINAHFFEPFPSADADAFLIGPAASNGNVYSDFESPRQSYAIVANAAALNLGADNHAQIVHRGDSAELFNTVAGSAQIVTDGVKTIPKYGEGLAPNETYSSADPWYERVNARTVIGLTRDVRYLVLLVVDKMTVGEAADFLIANYGVWQALNLDGGGSASLAMDNPVTHQPKLVNTPSEGPEGRAVGSSLAVFAPPAVKQTDGDNQRTQLNLARQIDTASGESQRNENSRVNPIDTNTERELTRRIGATATIVPEFLADRNYFASEYGRTPEASLHLPAAASRGRSVHGALWENHVNSITSARSFFQVGGVLPARDNDYGLRLTGPLWKRATFSLDGNQQKSRGFVNGNVLVPRADERTPLTTDPRVYKIVAGWLAAYPAQEPNLPWLDSRALNTNAPQSVDTNALNSRIDAPLSSSDTLALRHQVTAQHVDAFQLVAGQNPDSDIHNHRSAVTWRHVFGPSTQGVFSAGFDRATTSIRPDPTSPAERVNMGNVIQNVGLDTDVPTIRTQNQFRYGGALDGTLKGHRWHAGAELVRTQMNSLEQENLRPSFSFQDNFGNDAVTNLRKGLSVSYNVLLGDTYRGYRIWKWVLYADDAFRVTNRLSMQIGLRYEPMLKPKEVNRRDVIPFGCSCGPLAPRYGLSYRLPGSWGVLRAAYALDYGQMFVATFGQVRMNLPNAARITVNTPNLLNPLNGLTFADVAPGTRSAFYDISDKLGLPYVHTYNASWEWTAARGMQLQFGYVGSRAHRMFETRYNNRGGKVAGIPITPGTVNARRADQTRFDVFRIHNGARSYFDAARVTLRVPVSRGFSGEVSYWFSKAIDYGTDYTSTVSGPNTRQGRSPSEFGVHESMRGPASFDQPHALLVRGSYLTPRSILGRWSINAVWLLKSGTPFTVEAGSDGPGFGNSDGQQSDRPHLIDPSVLGRTIGSPDTSEQLLPRSAFAFIRPEEYYGSLGRNTFRRGKITNVNMSIERNWALPHDWALQLRAESVNLFNTPQFDTPVFLLASPTFGKITNTLNSGRVFHFRVQLQF